MAQKEERRKPGEGSIYKEMTNGVMAYTAAFRKTIKGEEKPRVIKKKGFKRYRDAERWCFEHAHIYEEWCAIARGDISSEQVDGENKTFADVLSTYKEKYMAMELSSDKVRQQYLHYIELFKELYPLKIKNITAVKAQQVINSTGESYDVRKKAKTVLSSIMSFAVRQGWIQSHPVGKCTLPEYIKNDKEIFTADEEDRLWDYYHGNLKLEKEKHRNGKYISADMYKMCAAFTLILIHTAARPGEIYGVDPKNVDLSKNRILKSGIKTKKGKERSIIITPIIRPLIKEYLLEENKFQAVSDATIRLDCEKLYKKLGFKNHHVPSAGRTTGATRMVMSGATHENLKTVMGHTDIRTTDKYYIIADEKNAEAALIHSENVYMEHGDEDIESVDREIKRLQNKKADLMRKQAVKRDKTKMDVDIESHRDGSSTFTIKPGRDSVFHNESHDI